MSFPLTVFLFIIAEKVGEGHICLWCNAKSKAFRTTKAVQQHMIDKGHCKVLHDGDVVFEYADYYDYRQVSSCQPFVVTIRLL